MELKADLTFLETLLLDGLRFENDFSNCSCIASLSLRNEVSENKAPIRVDKFIEADEMEKLIEKAFIDSSNHKIIDESILL